MRKVIPEEIVKKLVEYLGLKQYFQDEKGWWIVVEGRRNWDGSGAWQSSAYIYVVGYS